MLLKKKLIKITFMGLNYFRRKLRNYNRIYDGIRIRETAAEYHEPLRIKKFNSFVTNHTYLGKNINFNGMKIYGNGKVYIGDNFHCGFGCSIITQNHNYKNNPKAVPYDNTFIIRDTYIGNNVWFGNNVTILPGAKIGEGVIVQAGSVVTGKIPPLSIIGGNPAKVFSTRDEKTYYDLVEKGKFH